MPQPADDEYRSIGRMKILMTGSSGPKVGNVVARQLAGKHELVGVDLHPGANTSLVADINAVDDWAPHLDGVDAVVHFAALHAPHRDTHSRAAFIQTNVDATAHLLSAAKATGVRRFLLASTTSVYGQAMRTPGRAALVTEALVPEPEDIYDETKLAAEALCRDAFSAEFSTVALRFSRAFPEPAHRMALYRLYRGVDPRDVAQAFERALEMRPARFEAFNISGDSPFAEGDCDALYRDPVSVLERCVPDLLAAFAARHWPLPERIDRVYVIDKARAQLGYAPRFGWREFIADVAQTVDGASKTGNR